MRVRYSAKLKHSRTFIPWITPAHPHLNRIIACEDNQITFPQQRKQLLVSQWRKSCSSKRQRIIFRKNSFSFVGRDQRNPKIPRKFRDSFFCVLIQYIYSGNHQRLFCLPQPVSCAFQSCSLCRCGWRRHIADNNFPFRWKVLRWLFFCGNTDRNIDMHRAGLSIQRNGKRFVNRHINRAVYNFYTGFSDGFEQFTVIKNLMRVGQCFVCINAAREENQRYSILKSIRHNIHCICYSWTKRSH